MFLKYMKTLLYKMNHYDKKATNPFLDNKNSYNPFKSIHEQTYILVENKKDK